MSRFDATRRGRIAVWTGAALTWGTAVILAGKEPAQAGTSDPSPRSTVEAEDVTTGSIPAQPDQGLVIIRYKPSATEAPDIQTVYVQKPVAPKQTTAPVRSAPAPAPPAPRSGGS